MDILGITTLRVKDVIPELKERQASAAGAAFAPRTRTLQNSKVSQSVIDNKILQQEPRSQPVSHSPHRLTTYS